MASECHRTARLLPRALSERVSPEPGQNCPRAQGSRGVIAADGRGEPAYTCMCEPGVDTAPWGQGTAGFCPPTVRRSPGHIPPWNERAWVAAPGYRMTRLGHHPSWTCVQSIQLILTQIFRHWNCKCQTMKDLESKSKEKESYKKQNTVVERSWPGWQAGGPLLGSGSTFVPTISLSPPAALGGGLYRSQTGPVSRGGLAKWSRGPSPSTRLAGAWCLAPDLFSVMGK